ncbi:MAG: hypothetical protein JSW09_09415 [Pseudomonadota bacterium]|nr:MAG: hypothetical protein JSW09_09415 [Pseudomonadota bacterium]
MRLQWEREEARFVAACTRCGDCLRVCPTSILRTGDGGFPQVDFMRGLRTGRADTPERVEAVARSD